MAEQKFYAVKVGRKPGVYKTWTECKEQVDGFNGAVYKKFTDEKEAIKFASVEKKKKWYGVRTGKVPGVYETWQECKDCVDGVPNAVYKSFPSEEEAWMFVDGIEEKPEEYFAHEGVTAYVDGSFDVETNTYAYGVAILNGDKEIHMSGKDNDPEMAKMRNVAGEILGSMAAMQYALDNGLSEITIVHDYIGISAWCGNGDVAWKANKEGTIAYKEFYKEVSKSVKIKFQKVKGHSNNFYNDVVDALAKMELDIEVKGAIKEHIEAVARKADKN